MDLQKYPVNSFGEKMDGDSKIISHEKLQCGAYLFVFIGWIQIHHFSCIEVRVCFLDVLN